MNAPKSIWIGLDTVSWNSEETRNHDQKYIRADIVEETREALIDLKQWVSGTGYDKAQAALKRLEEE